MRKIVVEEDRILRLVQVVLDPAASPERVAAFVDYNSLDTPDFPGWLAALRQELPALYPAQVALVNSQEELRAQLPGADAVIVESLEVGAAELALAPKLSTVQNFGAIAANVDAAACAGRNIPCKTLRRRTNIAMGEHTMMLMLALAKRLPLIDGLVTSERLAAAGLAFRPYDSRHTAKANFGRVPNLRTLSGSTLGLLGFGEIAREVAMMVRPFGMRVLYNKRQRLEAGEEAAYGVSYCSFDELFAAADFLSVHIPLSDATRDLVNQATLARMQRGAYLINTSRAEIVNHQALVAALQSGQLGGAGLDVLYQEPAQESEPLLALDNVVLTPHLGGASRRNSLADMRDMLRGIDAQLK
jgi:phosphoglycerate dehydrogenase-like enzyme